MINSMPWFLRHYNKVARGCMYVCMYLCLYVSLSLCISVSMYLCIYVSMYLCIIYVSMYRTIEIGNSEWILWHGFRLRAPVGR